MNRRQRPRLVLLNQMAGPMTWELAESLVAQLGPLALLTGHPDTLAKGSRPGLAVDRSVGYERGSFGRRFWSWLRYWLHACWWLWRWPRDVPLVLFSNPPLLVWLGWCLRILRGTRYAVVVHDVYPDVVVRLGHARESSGLIRIWRWLNRRAYQRAELVVTLTPGMARVLHEQFDARQTAAGDIPVIYPWADTDHIQPQRKRDVPFACRHDQVDRLTVLYAGNMGWGHDLRTMLAAAVALREDPRFFFLFVGAGPQWAEVDVCLREQQLANAKLLGWQPEEDLPQILATGDIAVVSLEEELAGLAIPSKAFYSLAAGTPLLVVCPRDGDLGTLVTRHNCGWHLQPGDVTGFVRILRSMADAPRRLQEMKTASRRTAEELGSRQRNALQLGQLLGKYLLTDLRQDDPRCPQKKAAAHARP